jgi:hypothetical protein
MVKNMKKEAEEEVEDTPEEESFTYCFFFSVPIKFHPKERKMTRYSMNFQTMLFLIPYWILVMNGEGFFFSLKEEEEEEEMEGGDGRRMEVKWREVVRERKKERKKEREKYTEKK